MVSIPKAVAVAAGVLLASSDVFAQSSVTLYGIADTGLYYQSQTTGSKGSAFSALDGGWYPSLFGLTGKEDLGGGLHASFKLESGITTTTGALGNSNGGLFGRNAYVELGGGFGTFRAGLQFSPFFKTVSIDGDPRGGANNGSIFNIYVDAFGLAGLFDSNAIEYLTPTIAGFSGELEYVPGGVAGSLLYGQRISASMKYQTGPFEANAAYYQARDTTDGAVVLRGKTIDVKYTFNSVKATLAATNFRNTTAGPGLDVYVVDAGANWHVNPALSLDAGVYYTFDETTKPNQSTLFAVGAEYSLSVRTTLYAQVAYVQNRGNMGTGISANSPGQIYGLPEGGTTGVNVGIRHYF
jgi:predicted porin